MATPPVRILLVEDNAADAQLTADMLAFSKAPRYEVTHVARLAEARALLAAERFAVVVLDLGLPDTAGLEGVCDVRAAAPEAALVVLSGLGSEAIAVEALASGAQDYLVKGRANEDTLQRSIRFAMTRHEADIAQRRLAAVVESSDDAIITMDLEGRIISWNAGAERLFGYAHETAIGKRVALLVPADRSGETERLLARVLAGERIHNHVTSRMRRDGSYVDVSLTLSAIAGADGRAIAVAEIVRDISASTRAAASLHAAQERFRIAFEEAPIGMALIGLDRCFMKVNAAFCEITGYAEGELEGSPTAILVPPDDPERRGEAVSALLAGATSSYSADRRFIHRAGHPIWVALNVTCVRDHDGAPQHFLGQMQDITDRRRYEDRLQHMADHDPLTGLLNRRAFERELRNHVRRGERYGLAGAALMIDLDHFKYYNDTLGHLAGDELITRVAGALATRLRESDVLARLGGDEFAVILPNAGEAAARRVASELLECVRGEGLVAPDGVRNVLTASIGVAFFDDEAGLQPEDVMVNADLAMYDAKEAGRDRASFYPASGHVRARMRSRVTWVESIRAALDTGRFELLAQPIVDLRGERARRYELLLRMRTTDGDLIPPAAFLRIAEHLDLVQEIDRWVVARATELLVAHPQLSLEVNLSGKSIGAPALLELTERLLDETGVDPGRLTFEITETAAVANIARARAFSERLRALGCRFALDDFGAGFGSFYYLKHLPFDYLKIDGEFVRNCASDPTDRLLVTAAVDIARGLGKETIAEFVGDDAAVAVLRDLGVDWGQGFHLGAPAPLADQLAKAGTAGP
ncbi:MAG TPA: EAL domain-containing protein [Solirubrobacteraceae bacterium]|nr:EAL domain-containing protein [Solirubrobacteraceae bacterium]